MGIDNNSVISGNSEFNNFVVKVDSISKTLTFEEGSVQTIKSDFTLEGKPGIPIIIRSYVAGVMVYIHNSTSYTAFNVDVKDNTASSFAPIYVSGISNDSGNIFFWIFPTAYAGEDPDIEDDFEKGNRILYPKEPFVWNDPNDPVIVFESNGWGDFSFSMLPLDVYNVKKKKTTLRVVKIEGPDVYVREMLALNSRLLRVGDIVHQYDRLFMDKESKVTFAEMPIGDVRFILSVDGSITLYELNDPREYLAYQEIKIKYGMKRTVKIVVKKKPSREKVDLIEGKIGVTPIDKRGQLGQEKFLSMK